MTVLNTLNKIEYVGDNTTTVFTYTFRVDNNADMQMYLGEDLQVGGYTVNRAGDNEGGDVTFDTPPALDKIVTLIRTLAATQGTDYQPYDAFPAETHEDALDKLTMLVQQLAEELSRVPKEPIGAPDPEPGYSHNLTSSRDVNDCHPTSAVTGLDVALTGLQSGINTNAADININAAEITTNASDIAAIPDGIGVNQTWQSVTRNLNEDIVNNAGRPITLSLQCVAAATSWNTQILIDGLMILRIGNADANGHSGSLYATIPAGATYRVNAVSATVTWSELR